ncbi:MAG: 4-hydroxy-tetrahydrodipicolinate reductase [Candidatus Helarchaeota archaeon]
MIRVCVSGADGNMGSLVVKAIIKDPETELCGALTMPNSPNIGKDAGQFVGLNEIGVKITDNINEVLSAKPDIFVDFTIASAAEENIPKVLEQNINCIIGTTALSPQFVKNFEEEINKRGLKGMISPNMSLGVNLFLKIAGLLASKLNNYDIEIIEAHHHRKKDSPSGTATKLARIIAQALGKDLESIVTWGRGKGMTKRRIGADEIGVHAIRGGDIVGEHTVLYAGPGERIELIHRAHSRECFAAGTVEAIKYIMAQKKSGMFQMSDLIM